MSTLVIDASVAAKWFLPAAIEPHADAALALLKRYSTGEVRFVVPDLFWVELGNIFWKAVRQRRWKLSEAQDALVLAGERSFPTVPAKDLVAAAFSISTSFDRSLYDSLYVALAIASKATLVTADEKLASALAAQLPVKSLTSLQ